MSASPEEIKRDIERTRAELSDNVNALSESVRPGRVVGRQMRRTRNAMTGVKERLMGRSDTGGSEESGPVSTVASRVGDAAQGNPLAAGVIAFGAGWLASSILPASRSEQELAGRVKDKATDMAQPVREQAQQAGQEMAARLKEPAKEAVEQVRSTATGAGTTIIDEAKQSAEDIQGETRT